MEQEYIKGVNGEFYPCKPDIFDKTYEEVTEQAIDPYDDEWCNQTKLNFKALFEGQYRIKPEHTYRPFKDAKECWQEMQKHQPLGWIKCKEGYFNIVYVDDYYVGLADKDNSSILLASKNSYQDNTFADGTPFGVKVEE